VLGEAVRLREALATIIYAALDDDEPAKAAFLDLEAIFKDAASRRKLVFKDIRGTSSPGLTWQYKVVAREIRSPVWLLAQAANDLLTSPQAIHIRKCVNSTCHWLFLDTSKNHSRRWCDMKICGNRNKARRFHLRQVTG
jgi:predicted RNA-binding Zn ribbon-like protein